MFWFKRNKTELVVFYDDLELFQMFPVIPANKMFPEYYRTLPTRYLKPQNVGHPFPNSTANQQSTIRGCYGINNFNNEGFILPLWCEHTFFVTNNNVQAVSVNDFRITYHEDMQSTGSLDNFHIFKLESPWEFQCNKDFKWMMVQNYFASNSPNWNIVPGLTDFYNQSTTNIFMAINKIQPDKEIFLRAGTPIAKFFPFTDDEIVLRYEQVDDVKKHKVRAFRFFFSNGLTKMIRAKKTTKERVGKCPFHK